MRSAELIDRHRQAGRRFAVDGVTGFALDEGDGEPVLCMHGVPTSSFLYRKVATELAYRGMRAVAFDLPGLGLTDRPTHFDYSWSGLGEYATGAVDALSLGRFHLVVHDIGGPVGFELAAAMPERVASITVLNTIVEVDTFRRPAAMEPLARAVGPVYLRMMNRPAFRLLMHLQGIADRAAVTRAELDTHLELLRHGDGGAALLRIMRGFERTRAKRNRYSEVLRSDRYPVQVLWGERDPALKVDTHGEAARRAAGVSEVVRLPGKHFLQEDNAPAIAGRIARIAGG